MLLLGLEFGGITHPWDSATVLCLIIFGAVVVGIFFLIEWRVAPYPLMPLDLFSKRSNLAALCTCFFHAFVFISANYFLPLYFQAVLGATPILSGVYLLPTALSLSFLSAFTGVFIKKTGQYLPMIWFGMTVMTLGFGLFIDFDVNTSWAKIIIFQIIAGIGVGPNFQSPLIALQSLVPVSATKSVPLLLMCHLNMHAERGCIFGHNMVDASTPMLTSCRNATLLLPPLPSGSLGILEAPFQSLSVAWFLTMR